MSTLERNNGIAMWRQIADGIRRSITAGEFDGGNALPGEMALAARFGVNRHTVRSAIAALVQEGVLRAERGRGTFVQAHARLSFPIRKRTRFSEGLSGQAAAREGRFLSSEEGEADHKTATALAISPGDAIIRIEMLYVADGLPISIATNCFPAVRFAGIAQAARQTGSITRALADCGVDDYTRHSTKLTARHADEADRKALKLSPGAIVMHATAVNVDAQGKPIQFAITRFAADRVELSVEGYNR